MNKICKICVVSLVSFFVVSTAFAAKVNRPEIESAGGEGVVVFENYNGPHSKIDSMSSIKEIGSGIGRTVAKDSAKSGTFNNPNDKYYVIHCIDPSDTKKLDADIFVIGPNATVDHIKILRTIIASYLISAYGYSEKDASTIATFITVYNAVYRKNLDYFKGKYKDVVLTNLSQEKCGLSKKYSEWAGQAQIVIPISDLEGGLSTIDTSVISDKEVIGSMQEDDDKGVDERKNMVEIKEKEAVEATEKAQQAAKDANEANKKAQEAAKEAAADPTNVEKQEAAKQAKDEALEKAQEAKEQQEKADKKQQEALLERTEIAKDQQKLLEEALAEAANKNAVIGLKTTDSSKQMSAMVKVDGITGETIRQSPVTVIRGRTIIPVEYDGDEMFMAIAGDNTGNGTVKLCLIDTGNMEIQKESNETVSPYSVLVNDGDAYYCVVTTDGKYNVAKYDSNLKLLLRSAEFVTPETPITVTSKGIIATASNGVAILLDLNNLSRIKGTSSSGQAAEK